MRTRLRKSPYRFKSGKFAGKTMEQVILRNAPRLYQIAAWARKEVAEKPRLRPLLREFDRLRELLRDAPVSVRCLPKGCKREPRWVTFALDWAEHYLRPGPDFWCDKHGPLEEEDTDQDESRKLRIHFDSLRQPGYGDRRSQKAIHLGMLEALGINKKPTRITEAFARRFFSNLS
jgi:hypothetical protein